MVYQRQGGIMNPYGAGGGYGGNGGGENAKSDNKGPAIQKQKSQQNNDNPVYVYELDSHPLQGG